MSSGLKHSSANGLNTVSGINLPPEILEVDGGATVEAQKSDRPAISKSLKEKTTKAERRALQEAQRAAKAASKEGDKAHGGNTKSNKPIKPPPSQKSETASVVAASDKKAGYRPAEKDRKRDVPQPRMQYDDTSQVERAKKHSVVKQTEVRNRVELFRHLPQYEHGTTLPDLESKFFQLDPMHPAVYKRSSRWR